MLKERLNEKDETIATLQATIKNLEATVKMLQENAVDLKATIANLTETLNEFKRKFFGISSEKSKKKQTDEPVCEEASKQESGIPVKEHTRTRKKKAKRDRKKCLSPAKKYKLYKSSINKSLHFAQRRLSSSTRGQSVTAQLNLSRE